MQNLTAADFLAMAFFMLGAIFLGTVLIKILEHELAPIICQRWGHRERRMGVVRVCERCGNMLH